MSTTVQSGAASETADLLQKLNAGAERFLTAAGSVPTHLERVAPAEGAWSVLQIAEHVATVEKSLVSRLQSATPNDAPNPGFDTQLTAMMLDRANRRQAPERSVPTGRFQSLSEALDAFRQNRRETLALIEQQAAELRKKKVSLPFGDLDAHQLLLVVATHPQRHAAQVEEVKNSPAYQAAQNKS